VELAGVEPAGTGLRAARDPDDRHEGPPMKSGGRARSRARGDRPARAARGRDGGPPPPPERRRPAWRRRDGKISNRPDLTESTVGAGRTAEDVSEAPSAARPPGGGHAPVAVRQRPTVAAGMPNGRVPVRGRPLRASARAITCATSPASGALGCGGRERPPASCVPTQA
jgi:hypothetical protein